MRVLHLTLAFIQLLITAFIFYSNLVSALPVVPVENGAKIVNKKPIVAEEVSADLSVPVAAKQPLDAPEPSFIQSKKIIEPDSNLTPKKDSDTMEKKQIQAAPVLKKVIEPIKAEPQAAPAKVVPASIEGKSVVLGENIEPKNNVAPVPIFAAMIAENAADKHADVPKLEPKSEASKEEVQPAPKVYKPEVAAAAVEKVEKLEKIETVEKIQAKVEPVIARSSVVDPINEQAAPAVAPVVQAPVKAVAEAAPAQAPTPVSPVSELQVVDKSVAISENSGLKRANLATQSRSQQVQVDQQHQDAPVVAASGGAPTPAAVAAPSVQESVAASKQPAATPLTSVNGGLGPLNLLAETLCNSQPERLIASDELSVLYAKRASLRKSLFELMSLKFTNLEKLSSKLSYAQRSSASSSSLASSSKQLAVNVSQPLVTPSHGWPVVGKCTAHDLKLMAEAAWCEERIEAVVLPEASRTPRSSVDEVVAQDPSSSSAVFSKVLHISDTAAAVSDVSPSSQAAATTTLEPKTRECRRKALRLAKALFNHLAENQTVVSESWPKLYAALAEDECARKRVVDIVSALSNFRGESSSTIRRDNVEFAFAMDDLRPKVLESEVTAPLTFDRQFIEVEQFLQQSVKLLMSNIDPERAKLTQLRYRSLMAGPASPDDQCVELHQRLLAKNYPSDCNPNQFGQLTDVLRMTAMSLDLWSVETELAKTHAASPSPVSAAAKLLGLADETAPSVQSLKECITSLVVS